MTSSTEDPVRDVISRECRKYGLPEPGGYPRPTASEALEGLLRHLHNNHELTYEALRRAAVVAANKAARYREALERVITWSGNTYDQTRVAKESLGQMGHADHVEICGPSEEDDHWTVSGDLRTTLHPDGNYPWVDEVKRRWNEHSPRSTVVFDPEYSCFYAYCPFEDQARKLREIAIDVRTNFKPEY
jgi:hypothetical protein